MMKNPSCLIEALSLDLNAALRTLGFSEDGFVAIKPMSMIVINVAWSVNPIYAVDKWDSSVRLDRWATSIASLDIGFGEVDFSYEWIELDLE